MYLVSEANPRLPSWVVEKVWEGSVPDRTKTGPNALFDRKARHVTSKISEQSSAPYTVVDTAVLTRCSRITS